MEGARDDETLEGDWAIWTFLTPRVPRALRALALESGLAVGCCSLYSRTA